MIEDAGKEDQPSTDDQAATRHKFLLDVPETTLTAYYTSEAVATDELHFQIIPDRYKGRDVATDH